MGELVKEEAKLQVATFCDTCGEPEVGYTARPRPAALV